ncbi:MAG: tRNA uridine-5-carboxymethylaminomethyl(34) synthesis GTPase MnmE [Reyranellaceae bacterium]
MRALSGTIFALATPPGTGGIAVLRLSGRQAGAALRALTGKDLPKARRASLRSLRDPQSGEAIDKALALWFPTPASFTGEDVVELHVHGGRAVAAALAEALSRLPDCRPAEPGEFSRRAFENGKLDLTEAEAIADLVAAETAAQRRQALRQLEGALGTLYEGWRIRLLRALAHLEAAIDFADEDLPQGMAQAVRPALESLVGEIAAHLDDAGRGERLREGVQIAIVGPPNAGKSSLLNLLARRDVAIVSAQAGTTRDVIEVHLDLGGWPVTLADTAGLRETADEIEREGVRRAEQRARQADLRLAVLDAAAADTPALLQKLIAPGDIVALNKIDLAPQAPVPDGALAVSVRTGAGIERLLALLQQRVAALLDGAGVPLTRQRHRLALEECLAALRRAQAGRNLPELVAEDVRLAVRALGRITGRVDVEDMLDIVFREFCIGK